MSDMNSSLIGFLKKKSLFSNSPGKGRRSRQNSRDSKRLGQTQRSVKLINNVHQNPEKFNKQPHNTDNILHKHNSVQNIANNNFSDPINNNSMDISIQSPTPYHKKSLQSTPQQQNRKTIKRNFNFRQKTEETILEKQQQPVDSKNIWSGIITKAITFESARLQSAQCLETMSMKLQNQISNINFKIDSFKSKIEHILNEQFANLKQKVYVVVQKIFEESEASIKNYIKEQERILATEINMTRETLIKQYEKIEGMKEQLNKPNWKKVAGELLASDLEQKIDTLLQKSKSTSVRNWQVPDFGDSKILAFQKQIRNLVKLKPT